MGARRLTLRWGDLPLRQAWFAIAGPFSNVPPFLEAGVTVAELSEQLLMSAKGIKASVDTLTAYRERMLTAIRIVTRSP